MNEIYTLEDVEVMSILYPDTFHIPDAADRSAIKVGEYVKVIFKYGEPVTTMVGVIDSERIWVMVTSRKENVSELKVEYEGTLANVPLNKMLKHGDKVSFTNNDISQVGD